MSKPKNLIFSMCRERLTNILEGTRKINSLVDFDELDLAATN